jgi:hypothetical protein
LRRWAEQEFLEGQEQVKMKLKKSLSQVHISFDIWTSDYQNYAFLGVVAHFVVKSGEKYQNQAILLAMRRLYETHTGLYCAQILSEVLLEYDLAEQFGFFMADNAETNDVAIKAVLSTLRPDVKDFNSRRGRCIGHIINLAAKAFLFGQDTEAFENIVEGVNESTPLDSERMRTAQIAWRKKGPLGKLHNIVIFIRSSSIRKEAFRKAIVGDKKIDDQMVKCDNSTRWNSHYDSIKTTLELQERISIYCGRFKDQIGDDLLTENDWNQL